MNKTEKAYLAGVIDSRGAITTNRHLRIGISKHMMPRVLRTLQVLGGYCTGFTTKARQPSAKITLRGKTYKMRPRTIRYYGFGVHATLDLLEDLEPYLTRRAEFRQRLRELSNHRPLRKI